MYLCVYDIVHFVSLVNKYIDPKCMEWTTFFFFKKMHLLASPAENTMKALEKSCHEVLFLGVLLVLTYSTLITIRQQ
jgi:hypothetical protein